MNAIELLLRCNLVVKSISTPIHLLETNAGKVGTTLAQRGIGGETMKTTTLRQSARKNILIGIGIVVGVLILNAILENVASFLAFYFA